MSKKTKKNNQPDPAVMSDEERARFDAEDRERWEKEGSPLDKVETYYCRFVVYPSEHACVAHVLWTVHTHLMLCWDSTPRLGFTSPLPESGKTRALEVTELFVPNPRLSASISPASMVRIIAKASKENSYVTVLYDELDVALSKNEEGTADLRSALNSGYRRNGVFTRCINAGADVADFPSYAPLAFAAPKPENLPDALATRTINIGMKPRAADEPKEDFELDIHPKQAEPIRDDLMSWCHAHKSMMKGRPSDMPVRDRAADIWKPLILIADAVGGEWPERAREAAVHLAGAARAKSKSGNDRELLLHIKEAFLPGDQSLHSDELVRRLTNRDESPWNDKYKPLTASALAARLKQYDIPPLGAERQMKLNGVNRNGYHRHWFVDAWKRHVDLPGQPNSTASTHSTKLTNKDKKVEAVERVEFPQGERATGKSDTDCTVASAASPPKGNGSSLSGTGVPLRSSGDGDPFAHMKDPSRLLRRELLSGSSLNPNGLTGKARS
jgi:hypothetical protein